LFRIGFSETTSNNFVGASVYNNI